MINLTFGEQVKIILSRKGMTIKELAEQIEERTGKKMSRQNLTQRLGRDNFQEQDMRMIAEILGCSFQLSILASVEAEKASYIAEVPPTATELGKLAAKKEQKVAKAAKAADNDITIGEYVDIMEDQVVVPETQEAEPETAEAAAEPETVSEPEVLHSVKEPAAEKKSNYSGYAQKTPKSKDFQPIRKKEEDPEDLTIGERNPYTGHEFQTNSVRMHPRRIGYVQVYDRKTHSWTDMTEWAFLGMEEKKKSTMGAAYEPPIYLD